MKLVLALLSTFEMGRAGLSHFITVVSSAQLASLLESLADLAVVGSLVGGKVAGHSQVQALLEFRGEITKTWHHPAGAFLIVAIHAQMFVADTIDLVALLLRGVFSAYIVELLAHSTAVGMSEHTHLWADMSQGITGIFSSGCLVAIINISLAYYQLECNIA